MSHEQLKHFVGTVIFIRYFESGNYKSFIKSKVVPYLARRLDVSVSEVYAVPVFCSKDISLRIEKNEAVSRSLTGATFPFRSPPAHPCHPLMH